MKAGWNNIDLSTQPLCFPPVVVTLIPKPGLYLFQKWTKH